MKTLTQDDIKAQLSRLKNEHRLLDETIRDSIHDPLFDQIRMQRLKKRKLALKDEIASLENRIIPDIIA